MSRIAYVNGMYVPLGDAAVHVEDRGYQFADGVYEVCGVRGGVLMDEALHLDRLVRSLGEIKMRMPMSRTALRLVMRELLRRNRLEDGTVYVQVTRGTAPRDHAFPAADTPPTLVMIARRQNLAQVESRAAKGVAVITMPDIRWGRCDIKTVALIPNVLAKQAAREAGAYEAWLVDANGLVTEGSSTNAWIVTKAREVVTRPLDRHILHGITRHVVKNLAAARGLKVVERPFSVEEAKKAREAFLTAATALVTSVVEIDGTVIANGAPGEIATGLREAYLAAALAPGEPERALPI